MKTWFGLSTAFLAFLTPMIAATAAPRSDLARAPQPLRVGTFDSRAVAVAFARSSAFASELREVRTEHEKAKSSGDTKRAEEIDAAMRARQEWLHRQAFGSAPIDDILAKVRGELPRIAREAGVELLVSIWSLAYREPEAQGGDVTDRLVALFDPDETTRAILRDLRVKPPLPAEEVKKIED